MKKRFLFLLPIFLFLFRGTIFRACIQYRPVGERPSVDFSSPPPTLQQQNPTTSLKQLISESLDYTCAHLQFSTINTSQHPDAVLKSGKANCIGYAALFAAVLRQNLTDKGLSERYEVKQLIGKLNWWGTDLHSLFHTPFFRDHDYNVIIDRHSGHRIFVDPSVTDYLGIARVRGI